MNVQLKVATLASIAVALHLFAALADASPWRASDIEFQWRVTQSATSANRMKTVPHDALAGAPFNRAQRLQLKTPMPPSVDRGSILLWVRPEWQEPRQQSQPLLSMRWNDPRSSYLALSEGWWEPTGAQQLYFVVSNQEHAFCSAAVRLKRERWTQVAVTWEGGDQGRCRIFVNGEMFTDAPLVFHADYRGNGELHVGSDLGSTDLRDRVATGRLAEILWLHRVLSRQEIAEQFDAAMGGAQAAREYRWAWLAQAATEARGAQPAPKKEARVIFDESPQWAQSRAATDRILDNIAAAGFNVYVPSVWHGAGAYYESSRTYRSEEVRQRANGDDALLYLLRQAHARNIEVHPWFTVALRNDDKYPEYFAEGTPPQAFDVHNEKFREFITGLIVDVLQRYPVDGINLDYIRSMGFCTSTSCITDYRAQAGRDLLADLDARGTDPVANAAIVAWQDRAVASIVDTVREAQRRLRPRAVLSVDGHPQLDESLRPPEGRNEIAWLKRGAIDAIFDMSYETYPDLDAHDRVFAQTRDYGPVVFLFANFDRLTGTASARPAAVVSNLVTLARGRWPGTGVAVYLREMLDDSQRAALRSGPFREPATPAWDAQRTSAAQRSEHEAEQVAGPVPP